MRARLRGTHAWSALFVQIISYEAIAPPGQLMSEACDQLLTRWPALGRIGIWALGIYLTMHLSNFFTDTGLERYDILARLPNLFPTLRKYV